MSFNLLYNLLQRQDSRSSMTSQELASVDAGNLHPDVAKIRSFPKEFAFNQL